MLREFFLHKSMLIRTWAFVGLVVFVAHQAFSAWLSQRINTWYGTFYDLLGGGEVSSGDNESMRERVGEALLEFVWIVAPAVIVHPVFGLIRNWWCFTWRRVLMESYLKRWNTSLPAIEGAAQRVHEDTQRFAAGIQGACAVVLHSIFTLAVFCPVLASLDAGLMGVALGAAVGGMGISVLVGWPLVGLEVKNQIVEAELRKSLVYLEDQDLRSNLSPRAFFVEVIAKLTINYRNLYLAFAALSSWLSFFDQAMVVVPMCLVAPRLFAADESKRFTLGMLMKCSNAFSKVFDALNVVSNEWLEINEFRSVLRRLSEFERTLDRRESQSRQALVPSNLELSDVVVEAVCSAA